MTALTVQPIVRGYPFVFSLQFNLTGGGALFLTSPIPSRVRGEFRQAPGLEYPLLAFVDTVGGSLTMNSDGSVTMSLTEAQTAAMPVGAVCLDFARLDSGVTSAVGVQFSWPVIEAVTAALS